MTNKVCMPDRAAGRQQRPGHLLAMPPIVHGAQYWVVQTRCHHASTQALTRSQEYVCNFRALRFDSPPPRRACHMNYDVCMYEL